MYIIINNVKKSFCENQVKVPHIKHIKVDTDKYYVQ